MEYGCNSIKIMSSRIIILALLSALSVSTFAMPSDIVSLFGKYMSSWCSTADISYRAKIENLCTGKKSCRVEDKIHADYQRKRGYMDYETYVLDSYLNMFETLMSSGIRFGISNINVEAQDRYPDGQILTFITADIKISGKINYVIKDLFLVRDDKISGIYTYSSKYGFKHLNGKLIETLRRNKYDVPYTTTLYDNDKLCDYIFVEKNELSGLLSIKGELIIPCKWSYIKIDWPFARGVIDRAGVDNDEFGPVYDLSNNGVLTPFESVINELDEEFADYYYPKLYKGVFNEGYAVVGKNVNGKQKYGYYKENSSDYNNVEYIYDIATSFQNGLAMVEKNGIRMIIDKNFNIVLRESYKYKFFQNCIYDNGLIKIMDKKTRKIGVIDLNGNLVIPCKYSELGRIHDGLAIARLEDEGKLGFIDSTGKVQIAPCFNVATPFKTGIALVAEDYYEGRQALIDTNGFFIRPFDFIEYSYHAYDSFAHGAVVACSKGKDALIDKNGRFINGFEWQHEFIYLYNKDFIIIVSDGQWGVTNLNGDNILQPIYAEIVDTENGYFSIAKEDDNGLKYGCINQNADFVVPCIYDDVVNFKKNGIAIVKYNQRVYVIDTFGNKYCCE